MTPNFSLSLSFDGIRLLHRVQGGWHFVGEVALDCADLGGALAALRAQAIALEPKGLRTKLLIPNEQIKYLSLDTTRAEHDDVLAALDGTTPYGVDELVVDFTKAGGRTYVAAVARETLDEAAGFAREHAFEPVCFGAVPEEFTFVGEAFLGALDGFDVSRDDAAVVVTGVAKMPAIVTSEPEIVPEAPTPEPKVEAPTASVNVETPVDPPKSAEASAPNARPDTTDVANTAEKVPVFSARPRAPLSAPIGDDTPTTRTPPVIAPQRSAALAGDKRLDPPPLSVPQGTNSAPMPPLSGVSTDETRATLARSPTTDAPAPAPAPAVTGVAQTGMQGAEAQSFEPIVPAAPKAAPTPTKAPEPAPLAAPARVSEDPADAKAPGLFRSRRKEHVPKPAPAETPAKLDEKSRMTVFGARKAPKTKPKAVVGGKPRFLGLILIAVLLLFLVTVAAWAAITSEDGLASWFGLGGSDVEIAETATDPAPEVAVAASSGDLGQGGAQEAVTPNAPVTAPVGLVLSPAEALRIYAATGVWQRAPRIPLTPRTETIENLIAGAIADFPRPQVPVGPNLSLAAQDSVILPPGDPPPAGTDFPRDANGFILATPEGTLSPDGILIFAGRPPVTPPVRPGTVTPEVAAPPASAPEAEAEPETIIAAPVPTLRPRARPGSEVAIAPDVAPDTDVVPEFITDTPTAGGIALTGLRPLLRPQGLVPAAAAQPAPEVETPTSAETPALEISPEVAQAIAAAPPSLIVNPTPQAITASLRPDARPRNFARVVTRARENQARAATQVAVVAPRAVTPSGPISGGVAQAATIEGAIDLRNVNLIGVFGTPDARRALVRLSNGRLVRVGVGDSLDGGRVQSIGDNVLSYTKSGRVIQLDMPDI